MEYLVPLFSIIMINILLSGDNALVIALASRRLTVEEQQAAILYGSAGAIGLRVMLTFIAVFLLEIPYLQMIGGILLLWIAIKLITDRNHHKKLEAKKTLWDVIRTIVIADVVMSLDNVIAIIGIAKGKTSLLIAGLIISIPIIIWGSKLIGKLIRKWPILIVIGAVFLGWTAGEMVVEDRKLALMLQWYDWLQWVIPSLFAAFVIVVSAVRNDNKRIN